MLFVSFLVMVKVRRGIHVFIQLLGNFMSRPVVFLEHIHFFSIPSATHDLTRSDHLIRIDLFF